jgi:5'-nucleotidase
LVAEKNFSPVRYLEPIASAQQAATELKLKHHCDVVICLSHLGTNTDETLAKQTRYIDVIVGGHTHKIVTNHYVENLDGDSVLLTQMGKSGARIGKITLKIGE